MPIQSGVLSTVRTAPLSYFVYSSLSAFGRYRGGELPGTWFVRALHDLGRAPAAIRQTLYRMEAEGELLTRKVGRVKLYRASAYAEAEIDAGLGRIFTPPRMDWDGCWTMVALDLRQPGQRVERERVVALLAVEGFAHAGHDFYVHPRDLGPRLAAVLSRAARPQVIILRGPLQNAQAAPALVSLWKVDRLADRYRAAAARLGRVNAAVREGVTDRDAFLLRFAVVFDFLGVAWDDPDLPREVLPSDWPGEETRMLAARLYRRLVRPANRFADGLLRQTTPFRARSGRRIPA